MHRILYGRFLWPGFKIFNSPFWKQTYPPELFTVNFQLSGVHSNHHSKIYKLRKAHIFKCNYWGLICILVEPLTRFSRDFYEKKITFLLFSFFNKKNIFLKVRRLNKKGFKNHIRKTCNIRFDVSPSALSNDENHSSLFCLYQKLFRRYSSGISVTVTFHNKAALIGILLLWYQLKNDEISQKNRALFLLSSHIKRTFPQAFYMEIKYLRHYFWIILSICSKNIPTQSFDKAKKL
jgi:hypothetical protein